MLIILTLLLSTITFLFGVGTAAAYTAVTAPRGTKQYVDMDDLLADFTVFRSDAK